MRRTVPWRSPPGFCVTTLLPLLWMVAASLMPTGEANALPPRLLPEPLDARALPRPVRAPEPGAHAATSVLVATATTVVSLLLNSMAGYAFAKLRFAGATASSRLLLAASVIPARSECCRCS